MWLLANAHTARTSHSATLLDCTLPLHRGFYVGQIEQGSFFGETQLLDRVPAAVSVRHPLFG